MKLFVYAMATLALVLSALAVDLQKQVIISYPEDTADWILAEAKDAIRDAGGVITHEYTLTRAFAATVGEKILDTVQAMGSQSLAVIEEDQLVSTY